MPAITFRYFFTSIFKHRHLCHSPRKALLIEFATNGNGSRSGSIAERPHAEEIIKFYTASNHPSITTLTPLFFNHKHWCHSPRKTLSTEFASKKLPGGDISWYGPKPHAARQSLETPSSHTDRLHMEERARFCKHHIISEQTATLLKSHQRTSILRVVHATNRSLLLVARS